jgi:Antitoxin Phd_YefM, type II toxin-antitoxin system
MPRRRASAFGAVGGPGPLAERVRSLTNIEATQSDIDKALDRSNVPAKRFVSVAQSTATTITTLSGREFNQGTSRAKKAAAQGPVFITDRGKPAHVLLSIGEYQRLTGRRGNIADLLAMLDLWNVEVEIPRRTDRAKPVELT